MTQMLIGFNDFLQALFMAAIPAIAIRVIGADKL